MKQIQIITILLFFSSSLAFNQTALKNENQNGFIKSPSDTLNYSLGAYLGDWILKNGFVITSDAVFLQGMSDAIHQRTMLVNDSIVNMKINAGLQSNILQQRKKQEEQLFASLKTKDGVGKLPSGVQYLVIKNGSGVRPMASDTVVLQAIGMFADGTVFEDTQKNKQAITILTSALIPGLSDAIQLMPLGSVWRIFIPAEMAYGAKGLQKIIPPNTALIYDINLVEVKKGKN